MGFLYIIDLYRINIKTNTDPEVLSFGNNIVGKKQVANRLVASSFHPFQYIYLSTFGNRITNWNLNLYMAELHAVTFNTISRLMRSLNVIAKLCIKLTVPCIS